MLINSVPYIIVITTQTTVTAPTLNTFKNQLDNFKGDKQ